MCANRHLYSSLDCLHLFDVHFYINTTISTALRYIFLHIFLPLVAGRVKIVFFVKFQSVKMFGVGEEHVPRYGKNVNIENPIDSRN